MTTLHLTHQQLCDVLLATADSPLQDESKSVESAQDHLRACLQCTAELQSLRASLSLFRHAASSYAGQVYAQSSINKASLAPSPRFGSHLLYWASAAALTIAVALPVSLLHHHHAEGTPQPVAAETVAPQATPPATESDEALLDGIAQDLSTDVPSPMQPLADPTGGAATAQNISAQRKN